jgi:metal-responsive CopG/Arc/MetJ family transcriptional regulator
MPKSAMQNLHVPLPADLNKELRAEARRSGQPATQLARDAIQKLLEERKREALHDEIGAYAEAAAGTQDLDSELENASLEHLLEAERSKR